MTPNSPTPDRPDTPHPPRARLRAYALGELPGNAAREVELHLRGCASCRAAVRAVGDELVRLTDALPPVEPSGRAWSELRRRTRPRRGGSWSLAAAVAALAFAGWGGWQAAENRALREDRRALEAWLSRPDVRVLSLADRDQQVRGRVLVSADRAALFTLPPPPKGRRYHAWIGTAPGWKFGDPVRWVASSADGVFEVALGATDYLCVSLEDAAPPAAPTWTRVVGFLFL